MEIRRLKKRGRGWRVRKLPERFEKMPLVLVLRELVSKVRWGQFWLVFSPEEAARFEQAGILLIGEDARRPGPAEAFLEAAISILRHTWHGPVSSTFVPPSPDIPVGRAPVEQYQLGVHFGA